MKVPYFVALPLKKLTFGVFWIGHKIRLSGLLDQLAKIDSHTLRLGISGPLADFSYECGKKEQAKRLLEYSIPVLVARPSRLLVYQYPKPAKQRCKVGFAELLKRFTEALKGTGYRPFLTFGTLLGYVRDTEFIPWDNDLDIGFFYEEVSPARIAEKLRSEGFIIFKTPSDTYPCKIECCLPSSARIDITFFKREHDKLITFMPLFNDILFRRRTPFGLEEVTYQGSSVFIPARPELFLEENYGDWRTPNPLYDNVLDSMLTDHSLQLVQYLLRKRMYHALQRRDKAKTAYYLRIAATKHPDDPFWKSIEKLYDTTHHLH